MQQLVVNNFDTDNLGNPNGGSTYSNGLSITWQKGPVKVLDGNLMPNGCFVQTVINAAIKRLEYYQESKFECEENSFALDHLRKAMEILDDRTIDRVKRGVSNTHEA